MNEQKKHKIFHIVIEAVAVTVDVSHSPFQWRANPRTNKNTHTSNYGSEQDENQQRNKK